MPVKRRSELLVKVEQSPGVEITAGWGSGDAVDVLELEHAQQRNLLERQPASQSLSMTKETVGRGSRTITCQADVKGAEDGDDPTAVPDFALLMEACHTIRGDVAHLQYGALGIQALVKVGDKITGGTSGAIAYVLKNAAGTGASFTKLEVEVVSGAFATGEALNSEQLGISSGNSHASTPLLTTVALKWKPTSRLLGTIQTTANWSSDPAVGSVLVSTRTGQEEGGGIIVSVSGTTTVIEWTWGVFTSAAALTADGQTAVLNGTLTQNSGKSLTLRPNRAGLRRNVFGVRGTFSLNAEAGAQARLNFELTGKPTANDTDNAFTSGITFATTTPPRFAGGTIQVDGIPIGTRSIQFNAGNQVVMRADANSAEGDAVAEIVSRDPTITIEVDQLGAGLIDWHAKWKDSTLVVLGVQFGTTFGNTFTLVARNAQVAEVSDSDSDGIATHTITLRLRQDTVTGDNEYILAYV